MSPFTSRNILTTQTIGEKLQKIREGNDLTLAEIAKDLRIREAYLEMIESGRYGELPGEIYAREFVKAYAAYLGVDPRTAASACLAEKRNFNEAFAKAAKPLALHWRKKIISIFARMRFAKLTVFLAAAAFLFFSLTFFRGFFSPPELEIFSPRAYYRTNESRVVVSGRTEAGTKVLINSEPLSVNESGIFKEILHLPPGQTVLEITALGKRGQNRTEYRTVNITAAADTVGYLSL